MKRNRGLITSTLFYGMATSVQKLAAILVLPLFTRVIAPEQYGVLSVVSLVTVAASSLLSLGLSNSTGLLYSKADTDEEQSAVIWTAVSLTALNGLVWVGLLGLFSDSLSELLFANHAYSSYIMIGVVGVYFSTIANIPMLYLRLLHRPIAYSSFSIFSTICAVSVSTALVMIYQIGPIGVLLGAAAGNLVLLSLALITIRRHAKFYLDIPLTAPLVRIGFPSIFGLFAYMIIDASDRLMVEHFWGLELTGIYSVGYSIGMAINVAVLAFATAWSPYFISFVNNQDEAASIFGKIALYYLAVFGLLTICFFCFASPVVHFLTAREFHQSLYVVGIVAAGYAIKGFYLIFLPGIYFAEKLYLQSVLAYIAAGVNIALNFLLIPRFGITGAAFATTVTYCMLPFMGWAVSSRYLKVEYDWTRIFRTLLVVIAGCLTAYYLSIKFNLLMWNLLLCQVLVLIVFVVAIYKVAIMPQDKMKIGRLLSIEK